MAMIKCAECGNSISDMAATCPNCGYPVQAIKNAEIDEKNRKYFKQLNKERLVINIVYFLFSFIVCAELFRGEPAVWAWVVYFINLAIVLFLCLSWFPYIIGFFVHATQRHWHFTRASYFISISVGFAMGGLFGMRFL